MGMKAFDFGKAKERLPVKVKPKKKTLKELHIELWQWLIDNPGKPKNTWPGWLLYVSAYYCFACDEAERLHTGMNSSCTFCPMEGWGENKRCYEKGSSFHTWTESNCMDIESAKKIRDGWK